MIVCTRLITAVSDRNPCSAASSTGLARLWGKKRQVLTAVEDVSVDIQSARTLGLVGESGSGKTTLLRLLNKLISPDSGLITLNGTPLEEIDSIQLRRKVIMLQQLPAVFPGTIRDNLLIGLKFSHKDLAGDDELERVLDTVHLSKGLDVDSDKLSGGEKQRLALARVILLDPKVFLLDEPSSSLDEETERIMIDKLTEHARLNKKTLIMVTHSKKVAQIYGETIVGLSGGSVMDIREMSK